MKTIILNRIKEPSTWAGLAVLTSFFGVPAGTLDLVHQIVVGVCGLVAVLAPESGSNA